MTKKEQIHKSDEQYMRRALLLAGKASVAAAPNPLVGAVIVHQNKIIGEGYHQQFGEAHAEVNAVESVGDQRMLKDSTLYVTLEPCSHFGKTPPCADLIVTHQFKRVVVACIDSFSEVAGKGIARIRDAGISVDVGVLELEARELNKRFFTYHEKKRPYIILKWAQTTDGFLDRMPTERIEGINWITGPMVKQLVHHLRAKEQAILVGANTVIHDNPSLTVREIQGSNPTRVVLDPLGLTPINSRIYTDGFKTVVFHEMGVVQQLSDHVIQIQLKHFSVTEVLLKLAEMGIISVFVEGGAFTHSKFIAENLWDEAFVFQGDVHFENGIPAPKLTHEVRLQKPVGRDLLFHYRNT
jgi:diaminohydroxyphosphoribosylaminopyrimidine deaminase / 5-amino-6-(5-phosphoribosylamino)uracil reductase